MRTTTDAAGNVVVVAHAMHRNTFTVQMRFGWRVFDMDRDGAFRLERNGVISTRYYILGGWP